MSTPRPVLENRRVRSVLASTLVAVLAIACTPPRDSIPQRTAAPGTTLTVALPADPPGDRCAPVTRVDNGQTLTLQRTFFDDFDRFDPGEGKWATYFDGGYDPDKRQWLGADWGAAKRTLKGNNERQLYVEPSFKGTARTALGINPFSVHDGLLTITATRIPSDQRPQTYGFEVASGLISSRPSFVQRFGYFESQIRVPAGQAMWPAIWLLPANKRWPPEIDILEIFGPKPDEMSNATHWVGPDGKHASSGCRTVLHDTTKSFHRFGALWTPERIVYYIDGRPVTQQKTPAGVDVPMYMLINLAVGGKLVGPVDDQTPLPARMDVDYAAAYALPGHPPCATRRTDKEVDRCDAP